MLETYEEEVILRMYDRGFHRMNYKNVHKIASAIKWTDIASTYHVKKKFSRVLKNLSSKGYVDLHGKSGDVASLSRIGVDYAFAKRNSTNVSNLEDSFGVL